MSLDLAANVECDSLQTENGTKSTELKHPKASSDLAENIGGDSSQNEDGKIDDGTQNKDGVEGTNTENSDANEEKKHTGPSEENEQVQKSVDGTQNEDLTENSGLQRQHVLGENILTKEQAVKVYEDFQKFSMQLDLTEKQSEVNKQE